MRKVCDKHLSFSWQHLAFLSIICAMGVVFSGIISLSHAPIVYASANKYQDVTPCQNPPQAEPGSNSLLVVLLDRSGSLVANPGATDPQLYSASVTRALADLWPGKMAVVAFHTTINASSNTEQVQLTTLGPTQVGGGQAKRGELRTEVSNLPMPSLGTPTGPTLDKALEIIKSEGAPLSKVVLITDGAPGYHSNDANENDPSGSKEEAYIRTSLLKQFCAAAVPVDTIGLKTDDKANTFLSDIATGTGGQPRSVQDPGDLANAVLSLYGQWQQNHLNFRPLQLQPDNTYHVSVGDLAQRLNFFVFSSKNKVIVRDPSGQPLQQVVENSVDQHYVYDTLDLSPPRPQGDYTIDVGGDPQAQVYAFIESSLRVGIDTSNTTVNQSVHIEATLLDGQKPVPQLKGSVAVSANVLFTAPGQNPRAETVDLRQQKGQNLFTGDTRSTYPQAGQLQVVVIATYIDLRAESDIVIPIVCGFSVPCFIKQYQTGILIASPFPLLLLVVIILWLIWQRQPAPFGTLRTPPTTKKRRYNDDDDDETVLSLPRVEASHPLRQRIFQRSLLTSSEILTHRDAKGNFDFDLGSFDLLFKKGQSVQLTSTSIEPIIIKHDDNLIDKLDLNQNTLLRNGDIIQIGKKDRAIFSSL